MSKKARRGQGVKLAPDQITYLRERMAQLARRNPSWGTLTEKELFEYLAVQKITFLYDDEMFEGLRHVDRKKTGKQEEMLDAYLIVDQGDEIHLKLFQFKFTEDYGGGISTKELYAFVDRMNRVFLRGDLQDPKTLEAFREVRKALDEARQSNKRARTRIQCYYIVNGQNVSSTDASKMQDIRDTFANDRQAYGFTFETYGGVDIYNLCTLGRVPIQEEPLDLTYEFGDGSILHHNIGTNPNGMPVKVIVGFVNVNQLIRLVDRYNNNELFEKNVRLFLGPGKEVNRRIIETVTGHASPWFGFMNNGVSITAEEAAVDMPPIKKKVRVRLKAMQIINGCQTVNSLYQAKYAPEIKDRFQANSNVMVRIYQIDPANTAFHDALIIATNSQNAIRPEDLLSNDANQKTLQGIYGEYGVGYERKEGEVLPGHPLLTFSKEQAGMAYIGVVLGRCSMLRNSMSRREFFRQGNDYYLVFNLRGPEGDTEPGPLPDGFTPGQDANRRALQILAARCLEGGCRDGIAAIRDKREKGALRKGAYYLARIVFNKHETEIQETLADVSAQARNAAAAEKVIETVRQYVSESFGEACTVFRRAMADYLTRVGSNEDSALKNSEFAKLVDAASAPSAEAD